LPAGAFRDKYSEFRDLYEIAYFWTTTDFDYNVNEVYNICFDKRDEIVDGHGPKTENLFSVRCIKD
jgi:uncharacterized protein (TIGR02145 family)